MRILLKPSAPLIVVGQTQKTVINQTLHILASFGIPVNKTPRRLEMMALCFLALADVSHPDEWKNAIICGQVAFFWPFPPS